MSETDTCHFWETWAPYLSYVENNHLDLDCVRRLRDAITDPVLVVGAGQGLLVEELQNMGFDVSGIELSPTMIEYADKRRGIKLIHADAQELPFDDRKYETVIIATGVVDFQDDEELIMKIINEARRVATDSGCVLVAFLSVHPIVEQFLERIGIITPEGKCLQKRMYQITRLNPMEAIQWIRKEVGLGFFETIRMFMTMQFFLPKKEKIASKSLSRLWKEADDPDALIEASCEILPYRNTKRIKELLTRLSIPVDALIEFDSCKIARIK